MVVWRPVKHGIVSICDVHAGRVSLLDLLKINAILDAEDDSSAMNSEPKK